ncbi:MAG: ADP-ribosylglycohydrolase family protein [Candidatus Heimdallarchaeaceae archaeon]
MLNIEDRFIGAFIGSAIGDSIGEIAFYCNGRETLEKRIMNQELFTYTDDTAMTIGLAESLLAKDGVIVPQHLGKIFHSNYQKESTRGYSIGPATIFSQVEKTGESYIEAAESLFDGEGSYGNGAAMRVTPVAIFFFDSSVLYHEVKRSAIVTHAHALAIDGAAILAKAIGQLLSSDPEFVFNKEGSMLYIDKLIKFAKTLDFKTRLSLLNKFMRENVSLNLANEILSSDITALGSVPFAIYAFLLNVKNKSFKNNLLNAVIVAEDKDTIGAMVGALLGAHLGAESIPKEWLEKLENYDYIHELAKDLFNLKYHLPPEKIIS